MIIKSEVINFNHLNKKPKIVLIVIIFVKSRIPVQNKLFRILDIFDFQFKNA